VLPQLADVVLVLVDCQLARADRVKGGRVSRVLEVGAVGAGALAAAVGDCNVGETVDGPVPIFIALHIYYRS